MLANDPRWLRERLKTYLRLALLATEDVLTLSRHGMRKVVGVHLCPPGFPGGPAKLLSMGSRGVSGAFHYPEISLAR